MYYIHCVMRKATFILSSLSSKDRFLKMNNKTRKGRTLTYNPSENTKASQRYIDELDLNVIVQQFQSPDYAEHVDRNVQSLEYIIKHRQDGYILFQLFFIRFKVDDLSYINMILSVAMEQVNDETSDYHDQIVDLLKEATLV